MGALVLLTGTFAFMASGYAFYVVSKSKPIGILFGVLWALVILNLDRLLLTTFPKTMGGFRQGLHAAIRIVLAAFIGITIGHPLTVRMFHAEISDKIAEEEGEAQKALLGNREYAKARAKQDTLALKAALPQYGEVQQRQRERDSLASRINACETQLLEDKRKYLCEADGTCGTGIKSCGPVCREKKAAYQGTAERCGELRRAMPQALSALAEAERRLASAAATVDVTFGERQRAIEREYEEAKARQGAIKKSSFFAQSDAMDRLGGTSLWKVRFIILSLVLIEVMVVLIKVITPADGADKLIAAIHEEFVKDRLRPIAQTLANTGTPHSRELVSSASAPTTSGRDASSADPAPATVSFGWRRKLAYVVITMSVMAGMLWAGRSLDESLTGAALFVAVVSLSALQPHRQVKI